MKKFLLLSLTMLLLLCFTSCVDTKPREIDYGGRTIDYDDAKIVVSHIAEMYSNEMVGAYTAEDASAILYCYADKNSGEDISEEDLQKAIWEMIEYYEYTSDYFEKMSSGELVDDIESDYGDYLE